MLSRLRSVLRPLKRRLERRLARDLHPRRRRAARETIDAARPARSILILCLGNICRSPYAEQRLRRELAARGGSATITSAGFIRPGRPSPPTARRVAAGRGLDLDEHRSRVFTPEELEGADLVVVMSSGQRRRLRGEPGTGPGRTVVLGDLDPLDVDRRTIADPFDRPEEVFEEVYARIDRCCRALADSLVGDSPE